MVVVINKEMVVIIKDDRDYLRMKVMVVIKDDDDGDYKG